MINLPKKGASTAWVVGIIVLIIVGFIIYGAVSSQQSPEPSKEGGERKVKILEGVFTSQGGDTTLKDTNFLKDKDSLTGKTTEFTLKYIFGMHKGTLTGVEISSGELGDITIRGLLIFMAVWIIFLVIFMDMATIVTSEKVNGIIIGIAITVVFANFGLWYFAFIWLIGIFSFLAGLSVFASLLAIIVLGVGAHWGSDWAIGRIKSRMELEQIRRGGDIAAEGVKLSKKMAEAGK